MELESNLIDTDIFLGLRDTVHEFVHNFSAQARYKTVSYQTRKEEERRGRRSIANMLLREIPFTDHVNGLNPLEDDLHRRGSLDVLVNAVALFRKVDPPNSPP